MSAASLISNQGDKQEKKEDEMKKLIMSGMVMVMLVSLGGCFPGYPAHDRDGIYIRDGRYDRGERYDLDRDGEYEERR